MDNSEAHNLVEDLKRDMAELRKEVTLQKEIASLRNQVSLQSSYVKWIGVIIGVILTVLSFFGYRTWTDFKEELVRKTNETISEIREDTYNLSLGIIYTDSNRWLEAITHLSKYRQRYPYDEAAIIALLHSLITLGDFEQGMRIVTELKNDAKHFWQFKRTDTYNNIGAMIFEAAREDERQLDESREIFDKAIEVSPPGDRTNRQRVYWNLWRYYLVKGEFDKAKENLDSAYRIERKEFHRRFVLKNIENDAWFVHFAKTRPTMPREAEKMWAAMVKPR